MPPKSSLPPEIVTGQVLLPVAWTEADPALDTDRNLQDWAKALEASAGYFSRKKPDAAIQFGDYEVTALQMSRSIRKLAEMARSASPQDFRTYLHENFRLFRSVGNDQQGNVLVTAYYEPLLHGSLQRTARYKFPLYRLPEDLLRIDLSYWLPEMKGKKITARLADNTLKPYYDRAEIDLDNRLANKNLELAWTDDLVDIFFLQIQGSGRIKMEDGALLRVGYHGANGHAYQSIGKILIDEGAISREKMSLPALRAWLRDNPGQQDRLLNANPSYVFFRLLEDGPFGNIQVPLSPGRSIATDHRLFPKGAPALLKTTLPRFSDAKLDSEPIDWQPSFRFVVNQDTGGAIRGAGRVDLFLGFGTEAEQTAGVMKQSGSALYFIAPTNNPPQ
ncbi:MAG: MltA domain-containing protein [Magnetococcales bacterium]|nr:MltA domain-containing protein [Magnetococcales bacterium]